MAYTAAPTICSTTGRGDAKNRALAGVISAPPANSTRRKAPAASGMMLSAISAVMSQTAEPALAGALVFWEVGFPPSVSRGTAGARPSSWTCTFMFLSLDGCARCRVRSMARPDDAGPGGGASSPPILLGRVTIMFASRRAAVWPLVHARPFPATLLGHGVAEPRARRAGDGF